MSSYTLSTLNYPQNSPSAINRVTSAVDPPDTINRRFVLGDEWLNTTTYSWFKYAGIQNGVAVWNDLSGGGGSTGVAKLTVLPSTVLNPVNGNINMSAGAGISLSGTGNTMTITATGASVPNQLIAMYGASNNGGVDVHTVILINNDPITPGTGETLVAVTFAPPVGSTFMEITAYGTGSFSAAASLVAYIYNTTFADVNQAIITSSNTTDGSMSFSISMILPVNSNSSQTVTLYGGVTANHFHLNGDKTGTSGLFQGTTSCNIYVKLYTGTPPF